MEFILFVLIVVLWKVWLYPILSLVRFLPDSFFVSDSTGDIGDAPVPKPVRKPYFDSTPDPFIDIYPSNAPLANQFMSAEKKAEYLKSPSWGILKVLVKNRDRFKCKVCGSTHQLDVHHITYDRLGKEELPDLVLLCRVHHQQIHDLLGYDRTTTFDISTLRKP
jgi:transposase-like protein